VAVALGPQPWPRRFPVVIGVLALLFGSYLRIIPTLKVVAEPMGVGTNIEIGGRMFGEIMTAMAHSPRSKGIQQSHQASRYARAGGFALRHAEWVQRHNQAALEVMNLDKQILAARIREEVSQKDLDVQQRQRDHSEAMEELIKSKFSNEALYTWMSGELLQLHDRAFQLALDVARKAQRAFRHELARDDLRFIGGDYWQDGRNGLLAGERSYLHEHSGVSCAIPVVSGDNGRLRESGAQQDAALPGLRQLIACPGIPLQPQGPAGAG
jgi:Tc toxin complex TcA C-terminal TcB-binding domain